MVIRAEFFQRWSLIRDWLSWEILLKSNNGGIPMQGQKSWFSAGNGEGSGFREMLDMEIHH